MDADIKSEYNRSIEVMIYF